MSFCVHSIRIFSKFSGDPYYEPLLWFMISLTAIARLIVNAKMLTRPNVLIVRLEYIDLFQSK